MFIFEFLGLKFKINIKIWLPEDTPLTSVVEEKDTELGVRNSWIQIAVLSCAICGNLDMLLFFFCKLQFLHPERRGDGCLAVRVHSNGL